MCLLGIRAGPAVLVPEVLPSHLVRRHGWLRTSEYRAIGHSKSLRLSKIWSWDEARKRKHNEPRLVGKPVL